MHQYQECIKLIFSNNGIFIKEDGEILQKICLMNLIVIMFYLCHKLTSLQLDYISSIYIHYSIL